MFTVTPVFVPFITFNVIWLTFDIFDCTASIHHRETLAAFNAALPASSRFLGVCCSLAIYYRKQILDELDNLTKNAIWSSEDTNEETWQRALSFFKKLDIWTILVASFVFSTFLSYSIECHYTVSYKDPIHVVVFRIGIVLVQTMSYLLSGYFMMTGPTALMGFASSLTLQQNLFNVHIKMVFNEVSPMNDNAAFNKNVASLLRETAIRFNKLHQFHLEIIKHQKGFCFFYVPLSYGLYIFSFIAIILPDSAIHISATLQIVTLTLMNMSTLLFGQLFEDEWNRTFTVLCSLHWYEWNIQNRKFLCILLSISDKTPQFPILNESHLNNKFILDSFYRSYCFCSVFFNLIQGTQNLL